MTAKMDAQLVVKRLRDVGWQLVDLVRGDAATLIEQQAEQIAALTTELEPLRAQVASIGHQASPSMSAHRSEYPDDTEADYDILDCTDFPEAISELDHKYHLGLTGNMPRWSEGRFVRHIGDFIGDVRQIAERFLVAPVEERAGKAESEVAALRKAIEEASAALATEVIPFGDSMWRTWDKKILATRAVLAKALGETD